MDSKNKLVRGIEGFSVFDQLRQWTVGYSFELWSLINYLTSAKREPNTKFVIISSCRSDVVELLEIFKENPFVFCDGELLKRKRFNPFELIRRRSILSGKKVFGFELRTYQIESNFYKNLDDLNYLFQKLKSEDYKFIYVAHDNFVEQVLQRILCKAYPHTTFDQPPLVKYYIDMVSLMMAVKELEKLIEIEQQILKDINFLELNYEKDLKNCDKLEKTILEVATYLNTMPIKIKVHKDQKNKKHSVLDFYENKQEIIDFFKKGKYSNAITRLKNK